jgi:L-malate glycosyltransferase
LRVLWFTNIPMPAMDRRMGIATRGSGWWMSSLQDLLRTQGDVRLAVATAAVGGGDLEFSEDGVDYFVVAQSPRSARRGGDESDLRRCAAVAERWKPDLIHFHGTERFFGLIKARGLVTAPAVASIQGLLGPYSLKAYGDLSWREILAAHRLRELVMGWGAVAQRRQYVRGGVREGEIIRHLDGALVRTAWDRAHVWAIRPDIPLYHVGETLRDVFHSAEWSLANCSRHEIVVTTGPSPLKGLPTLIRAVALLRRRWPDVSLSVAGAGFDGRGGFARFIRRMVRDCGMEDRVRFLGWLDGEALARRLAGAHCFAMPSHIENSPNGLCEAMRVGLPCVAHCVGGVSSLVDDGRTGLLVPPGDEAVMAWRIQSIFQDDALAASLGSRARAEAGRRHDPNRVLADLMAAYRGVLGRKAGRP